MLVDICSFLPVEPSFRARLSGWAAIPGYFLMFARGISRFCGVDEEEFLRRVKGRPDFEVGAFIEEVAARPARGAAARPVRIHAPWGCNSATFFRRFFEARELQ